MAVIVATARPNQTPPGVQLDVTNAAGVTCTIVRIEPSGAQFPVRSAQPATLSSGAWTGLDYEVPYGLPVTYRVTTNTGDTATSAPVVLDPVRATWLIHPGIPSLSQPLKISNFGDRTRSTATGVHTILGRSTPVVITDGVRQAPTFPLLVYTIGIAEAAALLALLGDSSPLLLQAHRDGYARRDYYWVSIGEVTETEPGMYGQGDETWALPCTVVTAPTGLQQSPWVWRDVVDAYISWGNADAAYTTWRDMLINNAAV